MLAHRIITRQIRYFTAGVAAVVAVIYFMIGFNIVSVLEAATADQTFGIYAGLAYAVGAVLLVAVERRLIWVLGALLQIFVIYTYFNLAPMRTPAYEVWGILLRIAQLLILVALAYLAMRSPQIQTTAPGKRQA